jgi:pimeloyl-ACP methyl ester carboxylesterase
VRADFVFVHGFTQTAASWAPVMELLSVDTRSLAVPVAGDFTAAAATLDVGPATYAGYSQGGRLCLQLALDRPGVVDRLVLVSASPGIAAEPARTARREADERLPRERSGIDERRARNTIEGLTYQLRVLGQGAQPSTWARLGELRMPVLLIVGERDAKYVEIAERMAVAIPRARLEVVPGAGHACHLEQPETVAHLLSSW